MQDLTARLSFKHNAKNFTLIRLFFFIQTRSLSTRFLLTTFTRHSCRHRIKQYDWIVDCLPEFQSFVLHESQIVVGLYTLPWSNTPHCAALSTLKMECWAENRLCVKEKKWKTEMSNASLFCGTLEPTRMRWECGQVRVTRLRKGSNCAGVQRCQVCAPINTLP